VSKKRCAWSNAASGTFDSSQALEESTMADGSIDACSAAAMAHELLFIQLPLAPPSKLRA
jgi:hypothetical protein